ncbi:DnaD domain protein [Amphibacillus xylanus]|uniref:DnaB/C C-terminal domain-containing protein n=1 Tax=Amphibacillus xylanus (strain ATCC 51415 / DSM 6626 / JCM 7361 / LMG 17667 / NBRC 15112 / Ep01) TaxID=698758 RepID=K0IV78_AMPXN|nr:DnaD domain protein [Amphibacillus xylanus]BAM46324.1 hypothetical protein AXY_01920 [Amphibacillus xylanus NBRC 15112]
MAKYRTIYTEFWNDPKVMEEMTPEDKYFYLYILTNPNTKQIGVYKITKKQMSFDLGYSLESVNSLLDRFINHHKNIKYNEETREICVINWGKYNLNRGGKPFEDLLKKELKDVKDHSLLDYIYPHIEKKEIKKVFEPYVSESLRDTSNDTTYDKRGESIEQENGKPSNDKGSHDTLYDTSTISRQTKTETETITETITETEQQPQQKDSGGGRDNLIDEGFRETLDFYRSNIQKGVTDTPFNYELLQQFYDEWGKDLMLAALKLTAKKEAGMPFIEAVFKNWKAAGVKTVEDARRFNEQLQRKGRGISVKEEVVPEWFKNRKIAEPKDTNVSDEDVNAILNSFKNKKIG